MGENSPAQSRGAWPLPLGAIVHVPRCSQRCSLGFEKLAKEGSPITVWGRANRYPWLSPPLIRHSARHQLLTPTAEKRDVMAQQNVQANRPLRGNWSCAFASCLSLAHFYHRAHRRLPWRELVHNKGSFIPDMIMAPIAASTFP